MDFIMVKVKQYNPNTFLGRIATSLGVCVSQWGDRVSVTAMHELDYSRVAMTETHGHVVLWGVAAKNHTPCVIVIREGEWSSVYELTCSLLNISADPSSEIFLAALQTAPDTRFEKYVERFLRGVYDTTPIPGGEALSRLKNM